MRKPNERVGDPKEQYSVCDVHFTQELMRHVVIRGVTYLALLESPSGELSGNISFELRELYRRRRCMREDAFREEVFCEHSFRVDLFREDGFREGDVLLFRLSRLIRGNVLYSVERLRSRCQNAWYFNRVGL